MRLSHIAMVNWHLFDVEDIDVSGHIGILGQNRSGKSTILDMVQVVLAGSSSRFYRLNAVASEGKRSSTKRTVAGYCLGTLNEHLTRRQSALTYAVLGFVDPAGERPPISIGLALSAHENDSKETVLGKFILKGRIVRTADLIRQEAGGQFPKDWSDLRFEWGRDPAVALKSFTDSDKAIDFIREYMRDLVPNRPNDPRGAEAMLKALVNAISLKQDLTAEQFMRQFILEEKPIAIRELRTSIDTYRSVSRTIATLRRKLDHLRTMRESIEAYETAVNRRALEEWIGKRARCLAARAHHRMQVVEREAALARIAARKVEIDGYGQDIAETERHLASIKDQIRDHASKTGRATADGLRQLAAGRMETAETEFRRRRSAVAALHAALGAAPDGFADHLPLVARLSLRLGTGSAGCLPEGSAEAEAALVDALSAIEAAADCATERLRREAAAERRIVDEITPRLKQQAGGRPGAHLSGDTDGLIARLRRAGMDPRPLCDLLRIKDAFRDWTLAAEGLLGRDREAIFVARDHLPEATRTARAAKAEFPRASLVSLNKLRHGRDPEPGRFPAIFDSDAIDAITFVVNRYGNVRLAADQTEFEQPGRALMQDGYYDDGLVRRHQGARADDVKIGAEAQAAMFQRMRRDVEAATAHLSRLHGEDAALRKIGSAIDILRAREGGTLSEIAERHAAASQDRLRADATIAAIDSAGDGGLKESLLAVAGLLERQKKALAEVSETIQEDAIRIKVADNNLIAGNQSPGSRAHRSLARDYYRAVRRKVGYLDRGRPGYRDRLERRMAGREAPDASLPAGLKIVASLHDKIAEKADIERETAAKQITDREKALLLDVEDYLKLVAPSGQIGRSSDILTELKPFVLATIADIEGNALRDHEARAREASETATKLFRTQFVTELSNRVEMLKRECDHLNRTLAHHMFNEEIYLFRATKVEKFAPVIKMADIVTLGFGLLDGDPLDLLFDDDIPKEHEHHDTILAIRALLEDENIVFEEFEDYRNFYTFELYTKDREGRLTAWEKRRGTGSGAEQQVPIYVAVGASLAAVYGTSEALLARGRAGMALALFDEAFSRMDGRNQRQMMSFYETLKLQVVIAAPMEKKIALLEYIETIVEVDRQDDRASTDVTTIRPRARAELFAIDPDNHSNEELRRRMLAAE